MLVVQSARHEDVAVLHGLREAAARWQRQRGIEQWSPGEVTADDISAQVAAGEWFVSRDDQAVRAACRLVWSDVAVWGERPGDAGYVHGLVVDRARAGTGLGRHLLSWAGGRARDRGRPFLRLDCVQTNERLRDYYRALGFREVGRREFQNSSRPVVLMERPCG
ncbi:MAG: GNAT family N-acetyltransferase [Blastococcus sp.]